MIWHDTVCGNTHISSLYCFLKHLLELLVVRWMFEDWNSPTCTIDYVICILCKINAWLSYHNLQYTIMGPDPIHHGDRFEHTYYLTPTVFGVE